jgi:GNAT superfamily N-acetyltransferase
MPPPITTVLRTDSSNDDFQTLVTFLDAELQVRDGEEHPFYAQFNKLTNIKHVLLAYADNHAVGCGAFRSFTTETVEIKRMYVRPEYRGRGIASFVLTGLEAWARESGYSGCVLETGYNQPEAIALYKKSGYQVIPNYGPYDKIANSICFGKVLTTN